MKKIKKKRLSNILIFGYAFKGVPQTNDCRNSPGLILSKNLLKSNYKVYLYDNNAKPEYVKISEKKCENFRKKFSGGYL